MKKSNHVTGCLTAGGGPLAWIGAAGFFIMLIIGCGSPPDEQNNDDLAARLKRLETRVAAIELDADAIDAQEKRFDRVMADMERRQADLTLAVAKVEEQLRANSLKTVQKPSQKPLAEAAPAAAEVKKDIAPTPATATAQPLYHQVLKGDTVYSIARQYSLEPAELKKMNNLGSDTIVPGQRLRVK